MNLLITKKPTRRVEYPDAITINKQSITIKGKSKDVIMPEEKTYYGSIGLNLLNEVCLYVSDAPSEELYKIYDKLKKSALINFNYKQIDVLKKYTGHYYIKSVDFVDENIKIINLNKIEL